MNQPLLPVGLPSQSAFENNDTEKSTKKLQEVKVLADGNVMKLQKTRQRRILSCIHCHSKKIKCSRVQPVCDNCNKLGIECKYFVNKRLSRGRRKNSLPSQTLAKSSREPTTSKLSVKLEHNLPKFITSQDPGPIAAHSSTHLSDLIPKLRSPEQMKDDPITFPADAPLNYVLMTTMKSGVSPPSAKVESIPPVALPSESTNPMLQAPVVNSVSNNITNNFFNTNYANNGGNQQKNTSSEDLYSFNLSSFTFTSGQSLNGNAVPNKIFPVNSLGKFDQDSPRKSDEPYRLPSVGVLKKTDSNSNINGILNGNSQSAITNFVDGPRSTVPVVTNISNNIKVATLSTYTLQNLSSDISDTENSQLNNPSLHNSLNAYPSNPATTMNYLYGTNTYYESHNLLSDLINHLPGSKERSLELLDRYQNSVHIIFPVMVNLPEFIKEHEKFWDKFDPNKTNSSSCFSPESHGDFNLLQFYTLYFPILYAATISEFEEYDNLLLNQDINKYLKGFNNICQYYNYPHGLKSIPLLLGNVIIQSTSPNPSTMEMSQIMRYAKFLQLHKDPVKSLHISDWKIVRFRRVLWWVIFGLDALSSHNFCLPPVCKMDDFNVELPEAEDPVYDSSGHLIHKKLNVAILSMTIKFKYDRILSELVNQLHNALSPNISTDEVERIKSMIIGLFHYIHQSILKMNEFFKANPPKTVQEVNLLHFIKNHSWSYVDRAMMLLHKKILLNEPKGDAGSLEVTKDTPALSFRKGSGSLALSEYEDTFGRLQETNIIKNFDNLSISQLKFNQHELFTYENMHNNLIPSILHNLNDFLKYNDFIKFGKFNWYVKRTIPLDSIIMLFVVICVKFKYDFMTLNELVIYVNLINKALFILNRKYFKNEKYKRMLSLTNLTWEFILKKHNVVRVMNAINHRKDVKVEFFDYQVSGYMNLSELFNVMDVPQPALICDGENYGAIKDNDDVSSFNEPSNRWADQELMGQSFYSSNILKQLDDRSDTDLQGQKLELLQLNEKIYYDLRNNFVDIIDYCTFYSSLENVLHELMDYINSSGNIAH